MRERELIVAREPSGVVKVSLESGETLFAHEIARETTSQYGFSARAANLFGSYWSGQMKDLKTAKKRYKGVMAGIVEGTAVSAQRA